MSYHLDGTDIVIDGFENGIAPDPYSGLADMRNMNISGVPGEASVNFKCLATNMGTASGTITLVDAGDTVSFTGGGNIVSGMAITVGASVGGLTAGTVYYVLGANQLSLSYGGAAVAITSNTSTTYASINMGVPTARTTEIKISSGVPVATYYILDRNGRAWVTENSTLGNNSYWTYLNNTTITNASGAGIVAWKGYLLVFRNQVIDYVSTSAAPTNSGGANDWVYGWKTLNSNSSTYAGSHFAIVGQDDFVYYCDKDVVGSINITVVSGAISTFNPADATTFSYNSIALQLPTNEVSTTLAELGINLLVGGIRNFVYPWNRVPPATGVSGYSYPILTPEQTTNCIVSANNIAYLFCGNRGRIYATNGSNVQEVGKIPDHLTGNNFPYFFFRDAIWLRNKLFFCFASTNNFGTALINMGGVWSFDTATKVIQCENKLSYDTYAGFPTVLIAQFFPPQIGNISLTVISGQAYYAGWWDGVSTSSPACGVDCFTNASQGSAVPYSNYEPYFDTEKIPIGKFLQKETSVNMEFKLSKPLVSGEKVKILSRIGLDNTQSPVDATAGYTLVGETTYAANTISDLYPVNWEKAQWVQFRVRTSSTSATPSYVPITEIRLRQSDG